MTFDTRNVELQQKIPTANAGNRGTYTYIREESVLKSDNLIITKGNGSVIPAKLISGIVVNPTGVQVTLDKGAFASEADASRATVSTRAYYQFSAGAPVRLSAKKSSCGIGHRHCGIWHCGIWHCGIWTDDGNVLSGQFFDNIQPFILTLNAKKQARLLI